MNTAKIITISFSVFVVLAAAGFASYAQYYGPPPLSNPCGLPSEVTR